MVDYQRKDIATDCPSCYSSNIHNTDHKSKLGYKQFRCRKCGKQYNERTGTNLNFIEYPTEVVMMAVHYYYRFKVSLDDVAELMAMRNIHLSHQEDSQSATRLLGCGHRLLGRMWAFNSVHGAGEIATGNGALLQKN